MHRAINALAMLGVLIVSFSGCGGSSIGASRTRPAPFEPIPDKERDTPTKRWVSKVGEDCYYLSTRLGAVGNAGLEGGTGHANLGRGDMAYERSALASARVVTSV
jgi:hypothetical protein